MGARRAGCLGRSATRTVAEVVRVTCLESPEDGSTHWTTRVLARRLGIGKDTVARIWRDHNLKPWKVASFKIANNPHFEDRFRCRRALLGPARAGGRDQLRREDPAAGPGPYPAGPADQAGTGRHHAP